MADDKDKPKVINVDFTPDEAKAALENLRRELPALIASNREIAKLLYAKYLALVEAGFRPGDALELCKKLEW